MLQRGEDAWATYVPVLAQDFSSFSELVGGDGALDGFYDISSAGVGDQMVWLNGPHVKESCNRVGREFRDIAVELVFEPTTRVDEADFFPVLGFMEGLKIMKTQLLALVCAFPNGSGRSIAKKAEADKHAGFVIQIKSG